MLASFPAVVSAQNHFTAPLEAILGPWLYTFMCECGRTHGRQGDLGDRSRFASVRICRGYRSPLHKVIRCSVAAVAKLWQRLCASRLIVCENVPLSNHAYLVHSRTMNSPEQEPGHPSLVCIGVWECGPILIKLPRLHCTICVREVEQSRASCGEHLCSETTLAYHRIADNKLK